MICNYVLIFLGWGPYDEDHHAVRVQPCDHVFGDVCLEDMIDAPNGDKCPICRAVWFQPPTKVFLGRMLLDYFIRLQVWAMFAFGRLQAFWYTLQPFWYRLPAWIRFPVKAVNSWFYMSNVCYQIDFVLQRLTNIYPRNPMLQPQLELGMRNYAIVQALYVHLMITSGRSIALAVKTDVFYLFHGLCQTPWQWPKLLLLFLWTFAISAPVGCMDLRPLSRRDRVIFSTTVFSVVLVRLCFAQIVIALLYGGTVYNPSIFEGHLRS